MKRYIRASQVSYQLYRNNRNENKYIEVRKLSDGHTEYRQFLFWNTERGPVKNYYTSKSNMGRWHRGTQESVKKILDDYTLVESVDDEVKNDYGYVGSLENPNSVVSSVYVQKLIRKRPSKDRNGNPLVYSGSGGRSLVGINYDSIDKFDSKESAEEDLRKYAKCPSEWTVVEYEEEIASRDAMSSSKSTSHTKHGKILSSCIGSYRGYEICLENDHDQRYYFVDDNRDIHFADLEEELKSQIDKYIDDNKDIIISAETDTLPFFITFAYDKDGESIEGEDIVYAKDVESACRQWEEYCDTDFISNYLGCEGRPATDEEVERIKKEKQRYGVIPPDNI